MKCLSLLLFLWLAVASAHEHHEHEDMKGDAPISGMSLFQFDSKWTDQNGKEVSLKELSGQPHLIAMLYTRCQTACPLLVSEIQGVLKKLPEKSQPPSVVLFSFDSKSETPATMSAFLKKRKLGANWRILKGDKSAVAELAGALGVHYKELAGGDFIHSNSIFLVNDKGEVIASKDGLNTPDENFVKEIKKNLK